jgi:hypothetical protein
MHHGLSLSKRIPGEPDAGLRQKLRPVDGERRIPDERIGLDRAASVERVVRRSPVRLVPAIGGLEPETDTKI